MYCVRAFFNNIRKSHKNTIPLRNTSLNSIRHQQIRYISQLEDESGNFV